MLYFTLLYRWILPPAGPQVVAPRLAAAQGARRFAIHLVTYRLSTRQNVTTAALESKPISRGAEA
jgi:hypothetical protein